MHIRMLQLSKEKFFFKFYLILQCLIVPKMKKVVSKHDVSRSTIVIISYLKVKF